MISMVAYMQAAQKVTSNKKGNHFLFKKIFENLGIFQEAFFGTSRIYLMNFLEKIFMNPAPGFSWQSHQSLF